jgi:hypothetical protein
MGIINLRFTASLLIIIYTVVQLIKEISVLLRQNRGDERVTSRLNYSPAIDQAKLWENHSNLEVESPESTREIVPWMSADDPGQYILRETEMERNLGVKLIHKEEIQKLLKTRLCSVHEKRRKLRKTCEETATIKKSVSTTFGRMAWYSAVEPSAGALFAKVDEKKPALEFVHVVDMRHESMDVLVPLKSKERLVKSIEFAKHLSVAAKQQIARGLQMRLLITKFEEDEEHFTKKFLSDLKKTAKGIDVVVISCGSQPNSFNRAACANCLMAQSCKSRNCAVALLDVDLHVEETFLINSLTYISPGSTVYYPIFFSLYNPEAVKLVEEVRKQDENRDAAAGYGGRSQRSMARI